MKFKKTLAGIILTPFILYSGLIVYNMAVMSAEVIILCSLGEGSIRIPSKICEYYLFNLRDMKKDVEEMASKGGLSFILSPSNPNDKYKLAEFYIDNGLDVDGVNHYGIEDMPTPDLTPLHSATIDNDLPSVKFLEGHGADIYKRSKLLNEMTPLEYAREKSLKDSATDRSAIVKYLTGAENSRPPPL